MFSPFISTFYLFRKIFTCHREPSIHRGRARNIGLSYLAGDLKIIQARRSMHHRRDVNPGGGRNDSRDILSRWYSLQRFVRLFFMPIIFNNSELHIQYNNVHTVDGSEILHHLGCTKPINWCRISSINNIYIYIYTYILLDGPTSTKAKWSNEKRTVHLLSWKTGSLYFQPKQSIIVREIPQNYSTFALFEWPLWKRCKSSEIKSKQKKQNATIIGQSWVSLFHVHDKAKVEATRSEGSVTSSGPTLRLHQGC